MEMNTTQLAQALYELEVIATPVFGVDTENIKIFRYSHSKQRFREIVDSMPIPMQHTGKDGTNFAWNHSGVVIYINPKEN